MDPKLIEQHGLTIEEFNRIKKILSREPNLVELGMYSVLWSEHCSYKSSKIYLKEFPNKSKRIICGPGENAGVVDIGDGYAVAMKIESHNHPSAVEPFQGAATGVGGIVRDVFTMGARPIAALNSLRFGPLTDSKNRFLFDGVVSGISSYGNCLGLPTVAGEVYFDESYSGNCLVNAMCVGLLKLSENEDVLTEIPSVVVKAKAEGVGNPILYVGSSTGRDGIHGATFASVELDENSVENRSNVQVGDPFTEKLLIEACLELLKTGNVVGMQDMGAAGLTSSLAEMSSKAGTGVEIELSLVPQREENMTPYEIMLSESQERMVVVMKKGTEEDAFRIFKKWGLNAVVIGTVTDDGFFTVKQNGKVVARVPSKSLSDDAPVYERPVEPMLIAEPSKKIPANKSCNKILMELLSDPNISSKAWVFEQYDHMVQTNTCVVPGRGDAAVLRIKYSHKKIALTCDGNGKYCYYNPFVGGMIAVCEAARNLVCVGAEPIAVTDCLNFGNPEKPQIMWQFRECVKGMAKACEHLKTPVISGNVSFYNESNGVAIYPTPVVGMLGLIDKTPFVDMAFKDKDDLIILIGINKEEKSICPDLNLSFEKSVQDTCLQAIKKGIVKSAHDTSEGGLAVALAECCIEGKIGAVVAMNENINNISLLFDECQSRIIITINPSDIFVFTSIAKSNSAPFSIIGKVGGSSLKINNKKKKLVDIKVAKISKAYNNSISEIMRG